MTKRADLALNSLFCTNFALWQKWLKRGLSNAEMTKRADLLLSSLFCTNLCSLLKITIKWWAQSKNDKTFCSGAENSGLRKLVHFAENAKKWCENDNTG